MGITFGGVHWICQAHTYSQQWELCNVVGLLNPNNENFNLPFNILYLFYVVGHIIIFLIKFVENVLDNDVLLLD